MRKGKLLNGELLKCISRMGHGDIIVVASATFALPEGVEMLDLSLVEGVPSMDLVLEAIATELDVEAVTLPEEQTKVDEDACERMKTIFGEISLEKPTYRQFKILAKNAVLVVRTGSGGLYDHAILRAAR